MSAYKIDVSVLKPDKEIHNERTQELEGSNYFEVEDGDNGILLCLSTNDDSEIEILPGDSVFAGGSKKVPVYCEGWNFIHLESGRYVKHNSDGTNTIHFLCADQGVYCYAIQLT